MILLNVPDVVGFTFGEAAKLIEEKGMKLGAVVLTAPPRLQDTEVDEDCRVLRQKVGIDGRIELLVCNIKNE